MGRLALLLGLALLAGGGALLRHVRGADATALHVLDVGQGDAVLLRRGRVDVLVDGGPDTTVLPRLGDVRPAWDRRIDVVVLTHPQQDHLRGLLDVLERHEVGLVLLPRIHAETETYERFLDRIRDRGVPLRFARVGQVLRVEGLRLTVLAPDAELLRRAGTNANDGSIVLRGDAGTFSFLLTGDIEAPTEQYLARHIPSLVRADVLKVPHHGSKTSSTDAFLRAVGPELSVMSVGAGNRFGHPHKSVVRRYAARRLLRTDLTGTISLVHRGGGMHVRCGRGCAPERSFDAPNP